MEISAGEGDRMTSCLPTCARGVGKKRLSFFQRQTFVPLSTSRLGPQQGCQTHQDPPMKGGGSKDHSPVSANFKGLADNLLIRLSPTEVRDQSDAPVAPVASSRTMVAARWKDRAA